MSKPTLYCGCIGLINYYRKYYSDSQAIEGLKRLAIKKYAKLTDITVKRNNKWSRLAW